jgi:hypothetical protein
VIGFARNPHHHTGLGVSGDLATRLNDYDDVPGLRLK